MKQKIRYQDLIEVYSLEEVIAETQKHKEMMKNLYTGRRNRKGEVINVELPDHEGQYFGFEYIGSFLKLECGWVSSFEEICPFCIYSLVNKHGTKQERLQFNELNNIEKKCWISNKEYAMLSKSKRKLKKYWRKKLRVSKRTKTEALEFVEVK